MAPWITKAYWNAFTVWKARDEAKFPYRPLDHILAVQNQRIQAIVAHAYATVPYYREVMDQAGLRPENFRCSDDLAQLPLITGNLVAQAPERFRSCQYTDSEVLQLHSTGTSGRAKSIVYDRAALFAALAHGHRQRVALARCVGRTFGYREMIVARSMGVSSVLRNFYESYSWTPKRIDFTREAVQPKGSLTDNIAQINAFQPDVIRGYGSYIGALFRSAWEQNIPLSRPKAIVYGADRMADRDRQLIESEFRVPVLSTYQAAEALRIAFQCERRTGFHVSLDDVAIRVVDQEGQPVAPGGTGEIVLSNLTNRATVLLNYKLGDVVTLSASPCACGRTLPTLDRIQGRADDLIVSPGGQLTHALALMEKLQTVPGIVQMQLVQDDLHRFTLRTVYAVHANRLQTCQQLEAAFRDMFGTNLSLAIEPVDTITPGPGGKVKAVISHYRSHRDTVGSSVSEE